MPKRHEMAACGALLAWFAGGLLSCTSSKPAGVDVAVGSGGVGGESGTGGVYGFGGLIEAGGFDGSGAMEATGGLTGSGGIAATGGVSGIDAGASNGGVPGNGGAVGEGGITGQGGTPATDTATGGDVAGGGTTGTGGTTSACPTGSRRGGDTSHCEANGTGAYGSYQWLFWQAESGGCLTTYGDADAGFSVAWNNSGDLVARVGLQWDAPKTYDQLGTITARFAETKKGTVGAYSYIGIYGSSVSSCVEFYIIDDSFSTMPMTPPTTSSKGTAVIDGETYTFYLSAMTGTGASCSRSHPWMQVYSVRKTARQCGQISITDHFTAWRKAGIAVGEIDQIMLAVEALDGVGTVDFTAASITVE